MRIDELTLPKYRSDAEDLLRQAGYQHMGTGAFGRVWQKPGKNFVLKVFYDDPCYATYINMIRQHPDNPHFPKIIGKLVKIANETPYRAAFYGVRLERLSRENPDDYYDQIRNSPSGFVALAGAYLMDPTIANDPGENGTEYKLLFQIYPKLKEALDLLYQFRKTNLMRDSRRGHGSRECLLDIKAANILMRDQTPVFTDPLA